MTTTIWIVVSLGAGLLVGVLVWLTRSMSGYFRATFR
jgi:xanthosine utilization system XapX-like protein